MSRPPAEGITERQEETLRWIRGFIKEHDLPPTVREIGRAFDIESSTVFYLLKELERKGHLRRGNLGARSLILNDKPPTVASESVDVPILGRIAAGGPIEAIESPAGTIPVGRMLLRGTQAFALQVTGDSMVEAGIMDGDYVVVRKQEVAQNGDVVVALIEDQATLKRYFCEGRHVRLEPANKRMVPIRVKSGEFKIQGKVVGVIRLLESMMPGRTMSNVR